MLEKSTTATESASGPTTGLLGGGVSVHDGVWALGSGVARPHPLAFWPSATPKLVAAVLASVSASSLLVSLYLKWTLNDALWVASSCALWRFVNSSANRLGASGAP